MVNTRYFNRYTGQIEQEKVYGHKALEWAYGTFWGRLLLRILIYRPVSWIYGLFQDSSFSHKKVRPFIENFNINMDDFLPEEGREAGDPYSTFNQFFIRRFRPGKRPFVSGGDFAAFSEARYFGYASLGLDKKIPVKGNRMNIGHLLGSPRWEAVFAEGPVLLARLCPVDYHRFHFFDDGKVLDHYPVRGKLHSVNPLALQMDDKIFSTNERYVCILETAHFKKVAYVEVGALCVGKIVQSADLTSFKRGQEKGYFLFGGSTIIVLGEKDAWRPAEDILKHTAEGRETYIHLGDKVGGKTFIE